MNQVSFIIKSKIKVQEKLNCKSKALNKILWYIHHM